MSVGGRRTLRACIGASLVASATLGLGGCDWVDATGVQPGDAAADNAGEPVAGTDTASPAGTDIALDDLAAGESAGLPETTEATLRLRDTADPDAPDDPLTFDFVAAPIAEGALEACATIDGFDPARAPDTLAEACADPDECAFSFEPVQAAGDAGEVVFTLQVPRLRSPTGRRHALVGSDAAGEERVRREVTLCLIAINEAPLAVDDFYEAREGETLEVGPEAGVLANDEDDVDTGNAALTVAAGPLDGPSGAVFFELRPDGGFTWVPAASPDGEPVDDGFRYEVTDGLHVSSATVELRSSVGNRAPIAIEGAAPVTVRAGEFAFVDLSGRFDDPDGDALSFAIAEGLPDDGSLGLSADGVLSGVPGFDDVGEYALTLVADDGTDSVGTVLDLVVESVFDDAVPPLGFVAGTFDQALSLGRNIAVVSPVFEGGAFPLSFDSGGEALPRGVVVDPDTGRVAGRPRETGLFEGLAVRARDADGTEALSDTFSILVR